MKRLKALMSQTEFHIILFCLALILFIQPLLTMPQKDSAGAIVLSVFLPWGLAIVLLFLTSRSYAEPLAQDREEQKDGEMSDV